jgi:hypothetical protein
MKEHERSRSLSPAAIQLAKAISEGVVRTVTEDGRGYVLISHRSRTLLHAISGVLNSRTESPVGHPELLKFPVRASVEPISELCKRAGFPDPKKPARHHGKAE